MRIADSNAAQLAQEAWIDTDTPGIRTALARGLPGDVSLEDVGDWMQPALYALADADSIVQLEGRLLGVVSAALIVGAKLQETNGT